MMSRPWGAEASPRTQGPSGADAVANAKARQAAWKASREQPPWKENQPPWAWSTLSSAWSGDEMSRVERYSRKSAERAAGMDARDAMGRSRMPPPGYDDWDEGRRYDEWRDAQPPTPTIGQSVTTSAKAAWQAKQRSVAPWGAREAAPRTRAPPPRQPDAYDGYDSYDRSDRYDRYDGFDGFDWDEGRRYDEWPRPAPRAPPVTLGNRVTASAKAAWQAKQRNVAPGEWSQAWTPPEDAMPAVAADRGGARRRAPEEGRRAGGGEGFLGGLASYFNPGGRGWGTRQPPPPPGPRDMADDRYSYTDQPMTAGQSVTARAKAAWLAKQGGVEPGEWKASQRRR